MNLASQCRIVLVQPSHPGNIGAAARAMKNMGLAKLSLVKPKDFPSSEAMVRAAGADEILAGAHVTDDLQEAIADCQLVIGTSARQRTFDAPLLDARETAQLIHQQVENKQIAILFGNERSGLSNDELQYCHYHLHIPTNTEFSSLNLAAAVQVVCYELWMAKGIVVTEKEKTDAVTVAQMESFYQRLEEGLSGTRFYTEQPADQLMLRIRHLFNRTQLDASELKILHGVVRSLVRGN